MIITVKEKQISKAEKLLNEYNSLALFLQSRGQLSNLEMNAIKENLRTASNYSNGIEFKDNEEDKQYYIERVNSSLKEVFEILDSANLPNIKMQKLIISIEKLITRYEAQTDIFMNDYLFESKMLINNSNKLLKQIDKVDSWTYENFITRIEIKQKLLKTNLKFIK